MHIQTVDQVKAIKTVKGKISDIDKMKVEEQRKATRAGYDPDILPPDLVTFSKDAAPHVWPTRNERLWRKSKLSGTIKSFVPMPVWAMSAHLKRNGSRLPG